MIFNLLKINILSDEIRNNNPADKLKISIVTIILNINLSETINFMHARRSQINVKSSSSPNVYSTY